MGLPDLLKAAGEALGRLIPYRREEYKHEIEIRRSESPPCHQQEVRVRHPWMIWHTRVFVSHVDNAGKVTFQVIE